MANNNSQRQSLHSESSQTQLLSSLESHHNFNEQFLCSVIPNGKITEFNEFKTNCDNAVLLENDNRKHSLLVLFISKLLETFVLNCKVN